MDFFTKIFKPNKSGSGPSVGNKAPNPPQKSEHETYVEFAREFVDELVENIPDSSGQGIQSTKYLGLEDSASIASVVSSEKSCETLPDLLQPESIYKKQTDTDTDTSHTTEYESAVETDVHDTSSLNEGLLDDVFDGAENVDQQLKSQEANQIVPSPETHILQNDNVSKIITVDDSSSETFLHNHIADTSSGENVLKALEVGNHDPSFYDCVEIGDLANVTIIPPQGDITALCSDLENLCLDASTESSNVLLLDGIDIKNNSVIEILPDPFLCTPKVNECQTEIVADSSIVSCDLDTIHLVETEEHELSVLVLDKTGDISAVTQLKHISGDTSTSTSNTDQYVDALTLQSYNTLQENKGNTPQHHLLNNKKLDSVEKSLEESYCEAVESSTFQTCEAVKLSQDGTERSIKAAEQEVNTLKKPILEVPCVREENTHVEITKEQCVPELKVIFEALVPVQQVDLNCAEEKVAVIVNSVALNESLVEIDSSVKDLNFKEFKDTLSEEINTTFKSEKELIDTVNLIIKEVGETVDENVIPSSEKDKNFVTAIEDASLTSDKNKKELSFVEADKGTPCEKDNSLCKLLKEAAVDEVTFITEPVKETIVQSSFTSDEKNESVSTEIVEAQVDNRIDATLHESQVQSEPFKKELGPKALASTDVRAGVVADIQVSVENSKCDLLDKEETVEHSVCYPDNLDKGSKQQTLDVLNLTEDTKALVKVPEIVEATATVNATTEEKKTTVHEPLVVETVANLDAIAPHSPVILNLTEDTKALVKVPEIVEATATVNAITQVKQTIVQEPLVVETVAIVDAIAFHSPVIVNLTEEKKTPVKIPQVVEITLTANTTSPLAVVPTEEKITPIKAPEVIETAAKVSIIAPNTPVALNLTEEKDTSYKIPEVVAKSAEGSVSPIIPVELNSTDVKNTPLNTHEIVEATITRDTNTVSEQLNKENNLNVTQVITPSANLLDFDDLAAEAANVSNDFLTASQEVSEPDLIGESETAVLTKLITMADTGSAQKSDSVPLDVKWLADSQSKTPNNRTSNASSMKPADGSPRSKSDTRSAVIDCPSGEDPFKRRSLLQNSPPREVVVPNTDNKYVTPIQPAMKMEKGAGESSDVKENHSEAGPDTAETFNIPGEELFKDPSAFEFLSSMASTQPLRDFRKESLYVKFDPLVGSAPIARTDKNIPLPPTFQENRRSGDLEVSTEGSESERRHVTPVKNPALDLIDRLISLSPSPKKPEAPKPPPVVKQEPVRISPSTQEYEEMIEELHVLRELLARQDKAHLEEISRLKVEIEALQNKLNVIQQQHQEAEEREQKLNKKILDKAQGQKQMSMIMEEYEKTISRLVAEKEAEHQAHELEKETLLKEKDLALGHLTNIEIAFSDVHMKYERSKNVIEGFKKNEEVLRNSLAEFELTIHKQEQKYELLKSHAMQQLETANQELDAVRRSQQSENAKLKAMLKKTELKTTSLEEMLDQKIKENQELASICDDLISKVGN